MAATRYIQIGDNQRYDHNCGCDAYAASGCGQCLWAK